MSDHITQKIQKIVDLLGDCDPPASAPPESTQRSAAPGMRHLVQINMQPGAIVGQISNHYHYHGSPGEAQS